MNGGNIKVIGIGNEFRGDDAAGLHVIRRLTEKDLNGVEFLEQGGETTALMDTFETADTAILVDAVQSGGTPGHVQRFQVTEASLPAQLLRCSTHNFSVHDAIEMARVLEKLPSRLVVYGIEGSRFEQGAEMSPALSAGVDQAVQLIYDELLTLTGDTHA